MIVLVGLTVIVAGSIAAVSVLSGRHAWRWRAVPEPVRAGEGAYREGELSEEPREEGGMPWRILAVAGGGYIWGALTLFAFSPAGLMFAFLLQMDADPKLDLGALSLVLTCVSGTGLAVSLAVASTSLLRGRPPAPARARLAGVWALVHHAVVVLAVASVSFAGFEGDLLPTVAVPCALGAVLGVGYLVASRLPVPSAPNLG